MTTTQEDNMKVRTYFFKHKAFKALPYGATLDQRLMTLNAHIVTVGSFYHIIEKHPQGLRSAFTNQELNELKSSWDGLVVMTPAL